jgi:hypothetical protein
MRMDTSTVTSHTSFTKTRTSESASYPAPRTVLALSAVLAGLLPLVGNGLYAGPTGDGEQLLADAQAGPPAIAHVAHALELTGFVALCVLLATLTALLHRRCAVAAVTTAVAGAGMVAVKVASVTPLMALAYEAEDLDPATAELAHALNGAGFVACGFLLGIAFAAVGVGVLHSGVMPRWLGWWAAVAGSGAVVAGVHGILVPQDYVPVPFLMLLLWMIAAGVITSLPFVGRTPDTAGSAA